ncbi:putative nuclear distribution protein [Clavispora lusitaniae]|uniref:Nuclear distribution protein n=1 Tax=Clavispora lusitaniae TaxID=36911 RepID=A0ACD0WJH1_CLALS|nr:putative nuclear distribution protein [Clavispora lusitaniae]QFZ33316.1 putative nuclear distribution protein [Clavispora lusitaniae]QFZ38987.1 putative nuclear distribution protein [Clavispora lusitaniae]QFZ44669.1 putative nuclear distribution protein [Clavispora lusitaniae]QFZ50346.1 putative nuclear distribution protein [Clavispora lusitaniae]
MSILTSRQQTELHKAILQYMEPLLEEEPETLQKLSRTLGVDSDDTIVPRYLEKKWATVLRLQKKILDLENETNTYKALLAATPQNVAAKDRSDWLPSAATRKFATASTQYVTAVSIHPQLPWIVAACADGSVVAWDVAAADPTVPIRTWHAHTRSANALAWSHVPLSLTDKEEYVLASCSADLTIKIWAGDQFRHVRTLTGHDHTVSALAFSKSSPNTLYSVSRDKTVKVWDVVSGHCLRTFVGHSDWVRDVDVVSGHVGDFLLTCSNDQSVRLSHDSGAGLAVSVGHSHVVEAARFLPPSAGAHVDAYLLKNMDRFPYLSEAIVSNADYAQLGFKYAVSAGRDNMVKLWLLPPPQLRPNRPPQPSVQNNAHAWHIADLVGHRSWVRTLAVHPSGRYLFSGSDDKTIRVWDLGELAESGTVACVRTLEAHTGFVNAIHFAGSDPENMRCLFASGGSDSTVCLWS